MNHVRSFSLRQNCIYSSNILFRDFSKLAFKSSSYWYALNNQQNVCLMPEIFHNEMAERFDWAWFMQCGLYIYFLVWKVKPICFKLWSSLKYSPDIFWWSEKHWSVESHISPPLLATDLMFLLWNMDKRICRLCNGDPFKSVVESYLPFAAPSYAKDERHICSQGVSSSRQDPFPLFSSSSSDPLRVWEVPYSSI